MFGLLEENFIINVIEQKAKVRKIQIMGKVSHQKYKLLKKKKLNLRLRK